VTATAACDNEVIITPSAKYDTGTALFYLESVTVSDIDFNPTGGSCLGKIIELAVIDSRTNLTTWGAGNNVVSLRVSSDGSTNPTVTSGSNMTFKNGGGNATESGTAYFQYNGTITASTKGWDVTKIIIQSK
jgi:hypothetical protein